MGSRAGPSWAISKRFFLFLLFLFLLPPPPPPLPPPPTPPDPPPLLFALPQTIGKIKKSKKSQISWRPLPQTPPLGKHHKGIPLESLLLLPAGGWKTKTKKQLNKKTTKSNTED